MTTLTEALDEQEAQRLLRDAPLVRLGYNGLDATPRVIPIGFFWDGASVVLCTATTSPKVKALSVRPRVALTIDEGNTPADAKSLLLRGTAKVEIVPGIPEEYLRGAAKVMPEDALTAFEDACASLYPAMARIIITPTWARFFDFGAGRLPEFLQALASEAQPR